MRLLALVLVIAINAPTTSARRSKSRKEEPVRVVLDGVPCEKSVVERHMVTENLSWQRILREHYRYHAHTSVKHFSRPTLAFVTPWNSRGYTVATTFRGKFDFVSPTWLQLRRAATGQLEVTGLQDIDKQWMERLRAPPSSDSCQVQQTVYRDEEDEEEEMDEDIRPSFNLSYSTSSCPSDMRVPLIVPRLQVEAAVTAHELDMLAWKLAAIASEQLFDGFVFETTITPETLPLIKEAARKIKRASDNAGKPLVLIGILSPSKPHYQSPLTCKHIDQLHPYFDKFVLMTYDYSSSSGRSGPNAPLSFVRSAIEAIADESVCQNTTSTKNILLGIPLYGYRGTEAVIAPQLLQWLADKHLQVKWDAVSGEHFFGETMLTYPTPLFIKKRLEIATKYDMGVSLWELGQGMDFFYDLF